MTKAISYLFVLFSFISQLVNAGEGFNIIWKDDFEYDEKEKLIVWIDGVFTVVQSELGSYPFITNIYVHRSNGNEPVPWANTVRTGEQGIHFYVNTSYSLIDFQTDWTAPHELAHLSIPFLGKENMWFAEGYASFMQWYLLEKQGMLTSAEAAEKYKTKLKANMPKYYTENTFLDQVEKLKKEYDYPGLYWGGACYFFQVNKRLRDEKSTDLFSVISTYQQHGRMKDENINELISSLDLLSGSKIFSETFDLFRTGKAKHVVVKTNVD